MNFSRGYNTSRERIDKFPKASMSCTNCNDFYQASGDKEEVCQDPHVLKYDMIIDGNRIYCLRWKPTKKVKEDAKANRNGISKSSTRKLFKNK